MSHKLISLNSDLKRLRDEGFEVEVKGAFLLVHHVPYVTANREIRFGSLVSTLNLTAERTLRPETHVIHFTGEAPCRCDGSVIQSILHNQTRQVLDEVNNIVINCSFSNKPANGYPNYYEKVTAYVRAISPQAEAIDKTVTAKTFKTIEAEDGQDVFKYLDTNSSRAEICAISSKLRQQKIAIVGLGGTGSYVLDFAAKTPVKEIHLFDGDRFLQHNAFRSPGAASLADLAAQPKKVQYLNEVYSKMHNSIIPHGEFLSAANLDLLSGMDFVFVCIDQGEAKRCILENLMRQGIPFSDVGIGVVSVESALSASIRVTTCTKNKFDHLKTRVPFHDNGNEAYTQNIQIAELNALNAAMAVIRWKKLLGFYHDLRKEYNSIYDIGMNAAINDDLAV